MPKGKKKSKSVRPLRQKQDLNFGSEEESLADNSSVVSSISELKIDSDDDTLVEDEIVTIDDFESKLKDAIEGTSQKSAQKRVDCLQLIRKSLSAKCMPDFILERNVTLCDVVERSLKRGRDEEQVLGASVAALLCTQLGSLEVCEGVFTALQPHLLSLLTDHTVSPVVRSQCATCLGLCCFISCSTSEMSVESTMNSLYNVFSGSLLKGNGVLPILRPDVTSLHSSALCGWNLLLTVLPGHYLMALAHSHLQMIPQLLDSTDVDLRIAAGETLAVFYELARQVREDFEGANLTDLCAKLRSLATDSQKFRAKKDRRQQRSSFRDVLKAIEEREPPDIRVRIGDETLYIESWCHKRQYDAFCQLLGSGMNLHLKHNELLREIFELGEPIIDTKPAERNKLQRHCAHEAAFKARTKCMSKLRDKRSVVIG